MQHMLSVVATFAVLVAMSGIVPIIIAVSTAAQEVRPIEIARSVGQEQQRAETIDINSLTLDSDFSVFMRPGCPAELRLKALRKLWMLLPPVPIDENAAI
jgi:hypothetical protein